MKNINMTATASATEQPSFLESPRVALASGQRVGRTIQVPVGTPNMIAFDLACSLARAADEPVTIQAGGPLFHLPGQVAAALSRSGIPPGRLELALAAQTPGHTATEALLAFSALRDLGIEVALHGFGGPGSLDLIEHLPVSAIILHPALIRDLPGSSVAAGIVQRLLDIAGEQRVRVVASGIDSEPQRALLSGLGCHEGEGPLFGPAGQHARAFTCEGRPLTPALPDEPDRRPAHPRPAHSRPALHPH